MRRGGCGGSWIAGWSLRSTRFPAIIPPVGQNCMGEYPNRAVGFSLKWFLHR